MVSHGNFTRYLNRLDISNAMWLVLQSTGGGTQVLFISRGLLISKPNEERVMEERDI